MKEIKIKPKKIRKQKIIFPTKLYITWKELPSILGEKNIDKKIKKVLIIHIK